MAIAGLPSGVEVVLTLPALMSMKLVGSSATGGWKTGAKPVGGSDGATGSAGMAMGGSTVGRVGISPGVGDVEPVPPVTLRGETVTAGTSRGEAAGGCATRRCRHTSRQEPAERAVRATEWKNPLSSFYGFFSRAYSTFHIKTAPTTVNIITSLQPAKNGFRAPFSASFRLKTKMFQ